MADVLHDRHGVDQREVLMNERHTVGSSAPKVQRGVLPVRSVAGIGQVHARKHLDEGRLAGAVLAEQRVDFAGVDVEVEAIERQGSGEAFGDAAHREQ